MTRPAEIDGSLTADAYATLRRAALHAPAVLASSFGAEDMVLIDLIAKARLPIGVFTLDTGRLPEETHALMDRVRADYGLDIEIHAPDAAVLGHFVSANGANAFYASPALREHCCAIRKTEPLERALSGRKAWITGLRREQSVTRRDIAVEAFDEAHGIPKFNPLAEWSREDVWNYVRAHGVPYNALHDRGYASIGCAPCTRAIEAGEDERAGRWWWEDPERKECGLHRRPGAIPIVEAVVSVAASLPPDRPKDRRSGFGRAAVRPTEVGPTETARSGGVHQ